MSQRFLGVIFLRKLRLARPDPTLRLYSDLETKLRRWGMRWRASKGRSAQNKITQPVSNWDVATIKAAFKKAEKAQTGLGYSLSRLLMKEYLDYYMYHYVPKGKDGVQLKHMLGFACHPETLPVLRAMSTSDGLNRQQRQLVLDLNAEMETKRLFVQRVYNTESKVRGGSDIYDKTEHKYSRVRVEKLKLLFDTLDTAEIGKRFLNAPSVLRCDCAKNTMSCRWIGRVMHSWVYYTPVNKQLVQKLQRIFNHLNVAFSGKVCLGRVYRILRKSKELLQYIGDISRLNLSEEEETTAVSFIDMLEHLFKYTHHHQLGPQIISWANIAPTPMLDEQRLRDIQEMFKKCDEDGGGTISLEEFKESLVNSGIARSEAIRRFKDINSDGTRLHFSL
eukprot:jgi/Bigna1/70616/fgenesh1_pg.12_\